MSSNKEEEPPTSLVDSLLELRESLVSAEDDDGSSIQQTMTACQTLLQRDDLSPEIQEMVYDTWMKCAFEVEEYDQVLQLCNNHDNNNNKDVFAAYALYRLQKYEEANAKIGQNSDPNLLWGQHIQAQSLFRLGETQEALEHYLQILEKSISEEEEEEDMDMDMETITNALAVAHGNQVPFASFSSSSSTKALVDRATTTLANPPVEEEYPYDLAFNVATLQLLHGGASSTASAMTYLQQARQACQEALEEEGCSTTDIEKELMPIVTNLALATAFQKNQQPQEDGSGDTATTTITDTPPSLDRDVWNVYDSLVNNTPKTSSSSSTTTATKRLLKKEPPTNWTVLQKCIFSYNVALLSLRTGQHSHCRQALKQIGSILKKQNKKKNPPPESSLLWWQSRRDVMEAYCLVQEKKPEEALTFLQRQLVTLEQHPSNTEVQQSAIAYVKLHIGMLEGTMNDSQTCIELLEGLPPLIRDKRGVIATLASLGQKTPSPPHQTSSSSSSSTLDDASKAELSMAQGYYQEAATLYEKLLSNNEEENSSSTRLLWKAQHVHALTYVDAPQAETLWEKVKNDCGNDDDDDDDNTSDDDDSDVGELLEEAELPRLKKPKSRASSSTSHNSSTVVATTSSTSSTKKNQKSPESIKRRRAKRREAYLEAKGIPETQKPNPDRWIPKHERYGRRRRGGRGGGGASANKAHQGGGSQKDAAKLDAAARAQAKAAGMEDSNSRSTAHISVAGGPKRGGGGRRR